MRFNGLPTDLAGIAATAADAAQSPNTRRAYASAWRGWIAFCQNHAFKPLPAHPAHVVGHLAARVQSGASVATLRLVLAAIANVHASAGLQSPTSDATVKGAMRGFARGAAPQRQAKPLDATAVAVVRRHLGGTVDTVPLAASTMALVAVLSEAGLRRSEAAALTWDAVRVESDGTGRLLIRHSKTDAEGVGAVVAISQVATADLARWKAMQDGASVWGIGSAQVHRRIARVCADAGLGRGYGGHSGRVGMAVRLTLNAAPTAAVLRQGRWRDVRMLSRYTRNIDAAAVLRYI